MTLQIKLTDLEYNYDFEEFDNNENLTIVEYYTK